METQRLIKEWFAKWESRDFLALPITESFTHTSPFGTIEGKEAYLELVRQNRDKFLGYTFTIHDTLFADTRGCVRYTANQGEDFSLDVSEWYYIKDGLIDRIISYYHIGEIRDERKLEDA